MTKSPDNHDAKQIAGIGIDLNKKQALVRDVLNGQTITIIDHEDEYGQLAEYLGAKVETEDGVKRYTFNQTTETQAYGNDCPRGTCEW